MLQRRPIDFTPYCRRWQLVPDGNPIATFAANLLPVLHQGAPAMLKVAHEPDEIFGATVMAWWNGDGAARVMMLEGEAVLMERATGETSLVAMVRDGRDDEATRVICAAAARLHAPRASPLPTLKRLDKWFEALEPGAAKYGGMLVHAARSARSLFADPRDVAVLHGDLHHENVLDFGDGRGWLAIDPKGLTGDRGYDFANIVCNPERDLHTVTKPGRLLRQAGIAAEAAGYDRDRLLKWILAYAGLSAAWILDDGDTPHLEFAVADMVMGALSSVD